MGVSVLWVSFHRYRSLLTYIYTEMTVSSSKALREIMGGSFVGLFSQIGISFDMYMHGKDSVIIKSTGGTISLFWVSLFTDFGFFLHLYVRCRYRKCRRR